MRARRVNDAAGVVLDLAAPQRRVPLPGAGLVRELVTSECAAVLVLSRDRDGHEPMRSWHFRIVDGAADRTLGVTAHDAIAWSTTVKQRRLWLTLRTPALVVRAPADVVKLGG